MSFNDPSKIEILTQAPTVQRASQRLQMSFTASEKSLKMILRDIIQGFVQAGTKLGRKIFIKRPKLLG